MKLGYWPIRGLVQNIRYMLEYCGYAYEEVRYKTQEQWDKDKHSLGMAFPNLPYLIDGDLKLTQSHSILRYLAEKKGGDLLGKNSLDNAQISMLLDTAMDLRNTITKVCYGSHFEENLPKWIEATQIPYNKNFSTFLDKKKFMMGDHVTSADFSVFEYLDQSHIINPKGFDEFPNLVAYLNRFKEIPAIAKYRKSEHFMERPINGEIAHFK